MKTIKTLITMITIPLWLPIILVIWFVVGLWEMSKDFNETFFGS